MAAVVCKIWNRVQPFPIALFGQMLACFKWERNSQIYFTDLVGRKLSWNMQYVYWKPENDRLECFIAQRIHSALVLWPPHVEYSEVFISLVSILSTSVVYRPWNLHYSTQWSAHTVYQVINTAVEKLHFMVVGVEEAVLLHVHLIHRLPYLTTSIDENLEKDCLITFLAIIWNKWKKEWLQPVVALPWIYSVSYAKMFSTA